MSTEAPTETANAEASPSAEANDPQALTLENVERTLD